MRVRKKFLKLTSQTIPFGSEYLLFQHLPSGVNKDKHGNFYLTIGENFNSMFTCHLDTASASQTKVKHVQTGNLIGTDGTSILGADDKAGMIVLLYMIEKRIPGLYYFFVGEEVGCIGSSKLATDFNWPDINKVVSFDRRGTTSIITEQMYGRCCSDEFAEILAEKLNSTGLGLQLEPDDTGIVTDSAQFTDLVPECTNISVGYYNEHTIRETQDIEFLSRLCRACAQIDWESIPVFRTPGEDYHYNDLLGYDDEPSLYEDLDEFNENLSTDVDINGTIKKMFISKSHIQKESQLLREMLLKKGYNPMSIIWDGTSCYCVEKENGVQFIGYRSELMVFVPELEYIPTKELSDSVNPF